MELHFSPGVKGCEDEENVPLGFGFRPASSEVCDGSDPVKVSLAGRWGSVKIASCSLNDQNEDKKPNQGSLEDLSQDQTDDALPVTELINLQRKSPMIRNRKAGSMEVLCCSGTLSSSHVVYLMC